MSYTSKKDQELWQELKSGDDLALARLCEEYYEVVYDALCRFYTRIHLEDSTLLADVVTDSFIQFSKNPQRYQPSKGSLERFLLMDAEGDLKNAWQKRKRTYQNVVRSVELEEEFGNSLCDDQTPLEELIHKEDERTLDLMLTAAFPQNIDLAVAQLMLAGERKTEVYARLLQIDNLDKDQQKREVKRTKDRIDKVIRRKLMKGGQNV